MEAFATRVWMVIRPWHLTRVELQERIADTRRGLPIIFITGHGDAQMTVQAMKARAVESLMKPFPNDVLLRATASAIE